MGRVADADLAADGARLQPGHTAGPEQVLLGRLSGGFAISPTDPATFISDLEARRKLATGEARATDRAPRG